MGDHIERSGTIVLAGPVERAFLALTPAGESAWVPGWEPEYLYPTSGATGDGMVWRTGQGGETTLWACVAWDPAGFRARYARVTPGSRFGLVDVGCRALAADRTEATVGYAFTALGPAGAAWLDTFSEAAFAAMLETWRVAIDGWLGADAAAFQGGEAPGTLA
jgi:hypothetical protein